MQIEVGGLVVPGDLSLGATRSDASNLGVVQADSLAGFAEGDEGERPIGKATGDAFDRLAHRAVVLPGIALHAERRKEQNGAVLRQADNCAGVASIMRSKVAAIDAVGDDAAIDDRRGKHGLFDFAHQPVGRRGHVEATPGVDIPLYSPVFIGHVSPDRRID